MRLSVFSDIYSYFEPFYER